MRVCIAVDRRLELGEAVRAEVHALRLLDLSHQLSALALKDRFRVSRTEDWP